MADSWLQTHPNATDSNIIREDDTDIIQHLGITCNSPLNSWSKHKKKKRKHSYVVGDRLDYIFYLQTPKFSCSRSCVVFTEYIPGTRMSYSDHFGVHSVFTIHDDDDDDDGGGGEPLQIMDPTFTQLQPSMARAILQRLEQDLVLNRKTAKVLLGLFVIFFVIVVIIYSAIIAVPVSSGQETAATLTVTVAGGICVVLLSALATICLIGGFVFGNTEQRALRQFIVDVETLLSALLQQQQQKMDAILGQDNQSSASSSSSLLCTDS